MVCTLIQTFCTVTRHDNVLGVMLVSETRWGSPYLIRSIKYEFQDQNCTEFWNSDISRALGIYK